MRPPVLGPERIKYDRKETEISEAPARPAVSTGTGVSISLYLPKPTMDALFKLTPKGFTVGDTIRKLLTERLGQ